MQQILAVAILSLSVIFLFLTAMIVFNKAWREEVQRRQRNRRRELEPQVLAYAHGDAVSLLPALGGELRRRDHDVVEQILLDHAQRIRGTEHGKLARALDELGYVDEMIARLGSRRWWQRAEAAEKLGLSGAKRACRDLIPALKDDVPEVRLRAAKALGILGGTSSIRELVHALNEPNRWSIIRIADILTGMGRSVVDELMAHFAKLKLQGKLAALDILGRIRPLHAVPWLEKRLGEPESDVRARACHALGCIGDPRSAHRLILALADEAWPVRAMAAKALGRMAPADAVEPLCLAMGDKQWWVRSNAAHALRAMGTRGREALERMLESDDRFASHQAVLMLQEMGVVDQRARQLVGPDDGIRRKAELFIKRLAAAGQTGRLRALASDPGNDELRDALVDLLPELQPEAGA